MGGGGIAGGNQCFTVINTVSHGSGVGRVYRSDRRNSNVFVWAMERRAHGSGNVHADRLYNRRHGGVHEASGEVI